MVWKESKCARSFLGSSFLSHSCTRHFCDFAQRRSLSFSTLFFWGGPNRPHPYVPPPPRRRVSFLGVSLRGNPCRAREDVRAIRQDVEWTSVPLGSATGRMPTSGGWQVPCWFDSQGMRQGMTPINHPTGGFL